MIDSSPALSSRPLVNFKKLRAVGVSDDSTLLNLYDPSIFQISIIQYFYDLNGQIPTNSTKELHFCTEEDFPEDPSLFDKLGLSGLFCLDPKMEFQLEGYWDESFIKFVDIHLTLCNNATSNNTCQDYDEMKTQLYNKDFNVYYFDSVIDPSNYDSPVKPILVNEWTSIDVSLKKEREYQMANLEVETDDGIFFNNINSIRDSQYISHGRDVITVNDGQG